MNISHKRGFTLIELLVVIAIIGILAGVVLTSLGSARGRARDTQRIAQLKDIQLALELYFDRNNAYPDALSGGSGTELTDDGFVIPTLPAGGGTAFVYGVKSDKTKYHLGIELESGSGLGSDGDKCSIAVGECASAATIGTYTNGFDGADTEDCAGAATTKGGCYDVAN